MTTQKGSGIVKKKLNWWLLLIPALLIAVILAAVFWDAILIRIAPKMVLTSALRQTFSQLEERFQKDPLLIFMRSLEPDGKYTACMELETEKDILGKITYDMTVQTDGVSHQFLADGVVKTSAMALDLSLYMDADFMAVSSEDLVKGNYYGITYDTFASDMRKIPLLNFVVSDNLLSQWEDSVRAIQDKMSRTYTQPKIPEISREDMQKLLLEVAAMRCKIEKCAILLDGTAFFCYKLDYSVSGNQVGDILSKITNEAYTGYTEVTVSFYLYENNIVKISLACEDGEATAQYSLDLGLAPADGMLTLQSIETRDGQYDEFIITVTTQQSENCYAETWDAYMTKDGADSKRSVTFEWNPTSGDMILKTGDSSESLSLNFSETENGFWIATDDFAQLIRIISQDPQQTDKADPISCTMTVEKGSDIISPVYKNLDQWSMEDFWVLLNGIGSLFGIKIG